MVNQELLGYIRQQLGRNISREEIKNILMSNGWDASDVEEGFNALMPRPVTPVYVPPAYTPPITPVTPVAPLTPITPLTPVTPVMPITPVSTPVLNFQPQPQPQPMPNFINPLTASNLQHQQPQQPISTQFINPQNNFPKNTSNKNIFSYKGRIGRLRYFISSLILWIVSTLIIIGFLFSFLLAAVTSKIVLFGLVFGLFVILISVIGFFLSVKRFHDLNKSGWHSLLLVIPFYNLYLALGLLLECGTEGANQYGDDPLPVGKNHDNFANKLGKNTAFKIIITLLFTILSIVTGYQNGLARQQAQRQVDQNSINSLYTNNPNTIPTISVPVVNTPTTIPSANTNSTMPANNPVTVIISLGSQNTSQGISISFKNVLTFTNPVGVTTKGTDVAVTANGNSQELFMSVGEKSNVGTFTITLVKVSGNIATFSVK